MYRLIVETLLGLTREPERLRLNPRLPGTWDGFKLRYRYRETIYHLTIAQAADGVARTLVNGAACPEQWIGLVNDGVDHHVEVFLPNRDSPVPTRCAP
jgi:cyclic beta-1,2-glucan synthetase